MKVGEEHRNMVIISDSLTHDNKFVHAAQKIIIDFIKTEYPNVFFLDRYNICNLAHHHLDFNLRAVWTYSASGHGKGPCDGLEAVVKSEATQHQLRAGPTASFSNPKQFFEWCQQKNDKMVIGRPQKKSCSKNPSNYISETNRPIEIRYLSSEEIKANYELILKPRWDQLSTKGTI
jgi:hypothetical protein